ncbi:MAG: hypothetical protein N3G20_09770, partial [Verrucomicrobiae bacterium]|nr:hypothetical protein [Verrucomicrobiae bacterium]
LSYKEVQVFEFEPVKVQLRGELDDPVVHHATPDPNVRVFRVVHSAYGEIMSSCMRHLLAGLGSQEVKR